MNNFTRYHRANNFIEGLSNLPLEADYLTDDDHENIYLKRMRYFLTLLGSPDKNFKFIHITGTSGKGTVTNMVHEILRASGKKVGSFTSPFVTSPIEKIKVNDLYIAPDEFADIVEWLKPFINEAYVHGPYGRPSYFEIFMAAALVYFKQQKCEWVVLEVGCGGRYDATNIIATPTACAITNVDYDHTQLLGKTLKKIAYDKAGIIKTGSMVFTTETRSVLLKIFADICQEKNATLKILPKFDDYKESNRALATAITDHLGISEQIIKKGIESAKLMCRFEVIQQKPLVVLDGAHNRAKIKTTVENLSLLRFKKLYLIIGVADNKDHTPIIEQIIPPADYVFFTRFQIKDRKCAHPKELQLKSKYYFKKQAQAKIYLDPNQALAEALKKATADDLILVTGSFFLAGELRKHWCRENTILKNRKAGY